MLIYVYMLCRARALGAVMSGGDLPYHLAHGYANQ